MQWSVLVCCFRYRWADEIPSRKSNLNYRPMSLKVYQMPKHCTEVYDTVRYSFWKWLWQNCNKMTRQSNLAGRCSSTYLIGQSSTLVDDITLRRSQRWASSNWSALRFGGGDPFSGHGLSSSVGKQLYQWLWRSFVKSEKITLTMP